MKIIIFFYIYFIYSQTSKIKLIRLYAIYWSVCRALGIINKKVQEIAYTNFYNFLFICLTKNNF